MKGSKALFTENKRRQWTDFTKGEKKVKALTNGLCLIFNAKSFLHLVYEFGREKLWNESM